MSDELEARMWDDGALRYESRSRGAYFDSSEQLDRAPLLSEETYTEVPVGVATEAEHCHWKLPQPPSAVPQLVIALVLCGFFMICELIGGYLAGSLSVMCDAAHMLSDCGGFALALLAFHCAKRSPDVNMSYGYKRAEVLGAMVSVLLIWILTGVFVYVAAVRLHTGEYSIEPDMMMIVSGCGVAFNIILALVLHGCASDVAHHHTHGGMACPHAAAHTHAHSHEPAPRFRLFKRRERKQTNGALVNGDYSMKDLSSAEANVQGTAARVLRLGEPLCLAFSRACISNYRFEPAPLFRLFMRRERKQTNGALVNGDYSMKDLSSAEANVQGTAARNINLRAALIHVIGDLIQSCGVLLASVLIKLYPEAKMVDPICTFVFSVLVLLTSARVVRDALAMLMQAVPPHFRYRECLLALTSISGVRHVHSLHVWALSTHHVVLTAHIAVDSMTDPGPVLEACQTVARGLGAAQATFQVERHTARMQACAECRAQPGMRVSQAHDTVTSEQHLNFIRI